MDNLDAITKQTINSILEKLRCPLPIYKGGEYHILFDELIDFWRMACYKYVIGIEMVYVNRLRDEEDLENELYEDDYEIELKPALMNIEQWIPQAKTFFLKETKPVTSLVADARVYNKHFLGRHMTPAEIIKLVKTSGNSYLYNSIDANAIKKILLFAIKCLFEEVIRLQKIRIGVICSENIGVAQGGIITSCLFIDINGDLSHAYPCLQSEITALKAVIRDHKLLYEKYQLDYNEYGRNDLDEDLETHEIKPIIKYDQF